MKCLRPYLSHFALTAECPIARFAYDQCSNSPTVVISMFDGQRRPSQPSYIPSVAEAAVGFNSLLASGCLDHGATRSFENPFAKWESEDFILREGWYLAGEMVNAVRAKDHEVLYKDDVGERVLDKLETAARHQEAACG